MHIRIERGAATPVSRQIAEQVRAQCLGGLLKPGACLPSVRQLAKELVVNVNTIVRVYERLAAEGLVEMRHGEGTFVLAPAKPAELATDLKQQRDQFSREFQALVRRGLFLGLTEPQLRRQLTTAAANARSKVSDQRNAEKRS
jgi:DNA-binding transcriptional regulator YhcF (GntR family)